MEGTSASAVSAEDEAEALPEVAPELAGALRQLMQRGYGAAEAAEALSAAGGAGGEDGPAFRGALEALFRGVLESAAPEAAARWPGSDSAEVRAGRPPPPFHVSSGRRPDTELPSL